MAGIEGSDQDMLAAAVEEVLLQKMDLLKPSLTTRLKTVPLEYGAAIGFVPSDGMRVWTACNKANEPGPVCRSPPPHDPLGHA